MHEQPHPEQEGGSPESAVTAALNPRIYVASLNDVNSEHPHGAWIDAAQEMAAIETDIAWMLRHSPTPGAQTWAIYDHDDFAGLTISKHEDLGHVSLLASQLKKHGLAFAAWANLCHDPNLYESFEVGYIGHYDNLAAYGREVAEEFGYAMKLQATIPPTLSPYVLLNDEAFARDLCDSGMVTWREAPDGGVWVFDNQMEKR